MPCFQFVNTLSRFSLFLRSLASNCLLTSKISRFKAFSRPFSNLSIVLSFLPVVVFHFFFFWVQLFCSLSFPIVVFQTCILLFFQNALQSFYCNSYVGISHVFLKFTIAIFFLLTTSFNFLQNFLRASINYRFSHSFRNFFVRQKLFYSSSSTNCRFSYFSRNSLFIYS